jgi:hypothetical protein
MTIPGGVVTPAGAIPTAAGVTAENAIAIVPWNAGSGFLFGDKYATGVSPTQPANDAVFKNGSQTPFVDGISATSSHHQSGLSFDEVGTFNGEMIVTGDSTIYLYNAGGALVASYTGPAGYVLQAAAVAPRSYPNYPGYLFVTAMPAANIDNSNPIGNGIILTVAPGAPSGSAAVLFATTTGLPYLESIHFITPDTLSCSIGGFSYFASGYATGTQINTVSTNGAILAWTPAQLSVAGAVGHYLVQNEEFAGAQPGAIFMDAGLPTEKLFSDTTGPGNTGYQLEDTAIVQCQPARGCPATQGFWHQANHWPKASGTADGVTWDAPAKTLTIGVYTYTPNQILQLLPSGSLHTGGVENNLSQFIAAALNLIAGAQHTATIDGIIATIAGDLANTNLFLPAPLNIPAKAAADLNSFGAALDAYNSATGVGCNEGAGLNTGN